LFFVLSFSLMMPSLFFGYTNYTTAKEYIIEDVNQFFVGYVFYGLFTWKEENLLRAKR
jgi:hypothetical protein